jgi:hypothetical protein
MKKTLLAIFLVLGSVILIMWLISPVRPVVWSPDPDNGLTGVYTPNDGLFERDSVGIQQQFLLDVGKGPEDIVIGEDGYLYTGYDDGRIVRTLVADILAAYSNSSVSSNEQNPSSSNIAFDEFANTQGRPLGLRFDAAGNLIVADAVKGILSIDKQRNIRVLVDEYEGKKLLFVDHLDIANDGTIWFSDASTRFDMLNFVYDFLEASSTGRLLSYDPTSGETRVRMDNLFFANGVAVGPDDEFVLVNETGRAKIHRLWLQGDKAGSRDIFIAQLPAMPDNLYFKDGIFCVSLVTLRDPLVEGLAQNPFLRRLIGGVPKGLLKASSHYGFVIGVTPEGDVIQNLQSAKGYQSITTAIEFQGHLFLGSLGNSSIAVIKID